VWYYDPALVTGLTIGWVPIEEYTFFVLQTLMTGLWAALAGPAHAPRAAAGGGAPTAQPMGGRCGSSRVSGCLRPAPQRLGAGYLPGAGGGWLTIPLILQMLVGADVLWHHRRLVLASLLPAWLYLSAVDALAIGSGTWTINPAQTTGVMLGGVFRSRSSSSSY